MKWICYSVIDTSPWNHIFNPCFAANQPLHETNGTSVQQSVSPAPNLSLNSKYALNQSFSNTTFPLVQLPNQLSVIAVGQHSFNHDGSTNNASVVSSQLPNTTTNGVLFNRSDRSYQHMANQFVSTNQQTPSLTSKSFASTQFQSNQYYQSSASHSGRSI